MRKDREFQRLQRNLMELLQEQKYELDALREKGIEFVQHAKAKKATGMSWSARREAERAPAAAAEVFVHTKPWRTLTELKREAMAQRPWKGAKLRGAAAVAAAQAEAKT